MTGDEPAVEVFEGAVRALIRRHAKPGVLSLAEVVGVLQIVIVTIITRVDADDEEDRE